MTDRDISIATSKTVFISTDKFNEFRQAAIRVVDAFETEQQKGVCSFFVDTQSTHCVTQDGTQIAVMSQSEISLNQGGKWHTVDYLNNWNNQLHPQ